MPAAGGGWRVAVGGVEHETAQLMFRIGFTTEWRHFVDNSLGGLERGAELLQLTGTNSVVGGFVDGCHAHGLTVRA
jgi:hypothetical protein